MHIQKRKDKINIFYPYVTEKQRKAVYDALGERFIGQGPKVDQWEEQFKKFFGISGHPVAVNSGTAALETAYELAGLKPGDKVITTPFTCTATNIPLKRMGCELLFADIRKDTLNISLASIEALMLANPDVKAIVNVHMGGIQSDLPDMGVPVIDDCAQALGVWRPNATYSCYSFQAIKHITTCDGGMLIVPTEEQKNKAKRLRWFGIDREKKQSGDWQAYRGREMTFDIEELGYKRQPTDVDAAMGMAGLEDYYKVIAHRKAIFDIYKTIDNKDFKLIEAPMTLDNKHEKNTYWTAGALVNRRDDFAKKLKEYNIETNVVQVRNDLYTVFGGIRQDLQNMNFIEDKYIYIPLTNHMTIEDAAYIRNVINEGW